MDKNLDVFWQWVSQRMEERGIGSYRQLAEMSGVSHGTISQDKNQLKPPSIETAVGLCRALGVDWIELWTRAGYIKMIDKDKLSPVELRIIQALESQDDDFKTAVLESIERWVSYEKKSKKKKKNR